MLVCALIAAAITSIASAQNLTFSPFETDGVSDLSDLDSIDLNALLIQQGDDLVIRISNDSVPGIDWISHRMPTVTAIHFEFGSAVGSTSIAGDVGTVNLYRRDRINLPGGNNINFTTDIGFKASSPSPVNGLDPGESIDILFADTSAEALFQDSSVRIGLHVQQIGPNCDDSASYVTGPSVVPEPSIALLGALGLMLTLRRRRSS